MSDRQISAMRCAISVRQMILTGQFFPGEKINEEDLAGRMSMSRVPMREALSLLESEGLLTYRAKRGLLSHEVLTKGLR